MEFTSTSVKVPDGCVPCIVCGRHCEEAEATEDRYGLGRVIRIGSSCDKSLELDNEFVRTNYRKPLDAVAEWNEMNGDSSVWG